MSDQRGKRYAQKRDFHFPVAKEALKTGNLHLSQGGLTAGSGGSSDK
jgi:hypothetical protein